MIVYQAEESQDIREVQANRGPQRSVKKPSFPQTLLQTLYDNIEVQGHAANPGDIRCRNQDVTPNLTISSSSSLALTPNDTSHFQGIVA